MTHVAVIGAGHGDEGKGLMVDYFASTGEYLNVVRFNGGPQAGHTVELESGYKFTFSQLGSGSLRGLNTHLSRFVLVNPVYFMREYDTFISETGMRPRVSMSPYCEFITPWDVAKNQDAETRRGSHRHGSVGYGIFTATKRAYYISLTAARLTYISAGELAVILREVARFHELSYYEEEADEFLRATQRMLKIVNQYEDYTVFRDSCIFEGAQGLLLDQNSGMFPHVTPSNTGMTNVVSLLEPEGVHTVQPIYITRSYLTRHGAGPMYYPWVTDAGIYADEMRPTGLPVDETNHYNPWQGHLRYGQLSVDQLNYSIMKDMYAAQRAVNVEVLQAHVAMTWCNYDTGLNFCKLVGRPWKLKYESHGKTCKNVKELE